MEKLFRDIVHIISETDTENNDKAIRIFLQFHSYLIDNNSYYLDDAYSVNFGDILNVLETLEEQDTP